MESISMTVSLSSKCLPCLHIYLRGKFDDDYSDGSSAFSNSADGKAAQKKFWRELVQKLEAIEPGVIGNIKSSS